MKSPIQITFRHCKETPAIVLSIKDHAAHLDQFCRDIISCRVLIEAPHQHRTRGNLYHVKINLKVPGRDITVRRDRAEHAAHKDVYVAIRDAFDAARRQLEDFVRERSGNVKFHKPTSAGRVRAVFPFEDYGIIETSDGKEIYFHKNSVLNQKFGQIEVGSKVRFKEEQGNEGPQASTVELRPVKAKPKPPVPAEERVWERVALRE